MIYTLDGKELTDIEVEGIDTRDYPDFCDAYVSYAVWADTKKPLTDDELDQYNDLCRDQVYDAVMKRIF